MPIAGPQQGLITTGAFTADSVGYAYKESHEDQVMVLGSSHEVIIPQSGQSTGQRVHNRGHHQSVRQGFPAAGGADLGEGMSEIILQWYRTSVAGTQEHAYTTQFEDAIIVDIKNCMHHCQKDPANSHFTHQEGVRFTYRKITWIHDASSTSGGDDWRTPVVG
jgi:type VI secretion system secreted protein Hcp